jgi:hypothetical protein
MPPSEEVDAALEGPIQDRERGGFVALMAERHGAEAEHGHANAGPPERS